MRPSAALVALLLLACLAPARAVAARPKIGVLRLAAHGVDGALAANLDEQLAQHVAASGCCDIVAPSDLSAILGFEATKQRLGCDDESGSCAAEIAGALGVSHVLSGSVGRVGQVWTLNLSLLAVGQVRSVARSGQQVQGPPEALLEAMDRAAREVVDPFVPRTPLAPKLVLGTGAALALGAAGTAIAWRAKTGSDDFRQADIPAADRLALGTNVLAGAAATTLLVGVLVLVATSPEPAR